MPRHARRPARLAAAVVATLPLSMPSSPARAADTSWSSPASGRWLDPANWSTAALPTSADPVSISTPGGPYTVTLDGGTAAGPLTLNNPDATLLLDTTLSPSLVLTTAGDINITAGTLALHNRDSGIFVRSPSASSPINLTNAGRIDYTMDLPFQSYASATFDNLADVSNSGTIEVHDGPANRPDVVLQFRSVNTDPSGGTFTNTGTLRTGARSRIEANATTFNQNAGAIDGTIYFSGYAFNYNGGSVGTVVLPSFAGLNLAPAAGAGTFIARSQLWINNDLAANQTVYVAPTSRGALMGGTLTNAGHILVGADPLATNASLGGPTLFALPHPTDTLTNTGTLDINSPLSSPSTITGNVVNSGTVRVAAPYPNLTFSYGTSLAGNWTNSGSVSIAAGSSTALSTGSSFTQNAGGSLTIAAEPLTLTNGHFYYNGGTVSGAVTLSNSTVHFAPGLTSGGGTFTFSGSAAPFAGDIPAGVTVVHTIGGLSSSFVLSSFTNAGSLRTSSAVSTSARPTYRLENFAGTLTNTGSMGGTLKGVDRGIALLINGSLVNTGDIKANYLSVSGTPLATAPRPSFDQNAGTLNVDDLCLIIRATFNYNGGTITGKPIGITDSTLNISPNTKPASFTFFMGDNILHGSPAAGSTLALDALTPGLGFSPVTVTADPFTNAGTLSLGATFSAFTSTLTVTGSGALTNTGTLSVTKGFGGTRTLNAHVTNSGTFSVGPGATLTLNGSLTTSTPLDLQGALDLRTGPLTWSHAAGDSPIDTVRALLATGHLVNAAADQSHRLGYRTADDGTSIVVSLALTGDANLNGKLDADDFALLDRAFANSFANAHWTDGDFNYDGTITSADYLLLDTTLATQQGGHLAPLFLALRESQFGAPYVSTLLASVPEPSSLFAACGLALLPLARRRRHRK